MADFSINATSLQAPQGAGSQVVSPVSPPQESSNMPLLGGIVDIFAKGLVQNRKEEQEARKQAVVGAYSKEMGAINEALITGQIDPAKAGMLSRKITSTYQANNAAYMTELVEARKAFEGGTEIGEAQKKVEAETALKNESKKAATAAGFSFLPGQSEALTNLTIDTYNTELRVEKRIQQARAQTAYEQEQVKFGYLVNKEELAISQEQTRQEALKGLSEIVVANSEQTILFTKETINNATMSTEQKQLALNTHFDRVKFGLAAMAAKDPSLAAPYSALFERIHANAMGLTDTAKTSTDQLTVMKNEYEKDLLTVKRLMITDDKFKKTVAISQMFSASPVVQLAISEPTVAMVKHLGLLPEQKGDVPDPQLVGTKNQKGALLATEQALKDPTQTPQGKVEAVRATNALIKQVAESPKLSLENLKELNTFVASASFGKAAAAGEIDMPTMQLAKKAFQVSYEPAVVKEILTRLDTPIARVSNRSGVPSGVPGQTLGDMTDIAFSGGGVKIRAKPGANLGMWQAGEIKSMQEAEKGLNQLLYMAAHMEGSTNYEKYWNDNKSQLLPGVFVAGHEEGKIINGYKFLGGDARNPKNYVKVENAK